MPKFLPPVSRRQFVSTGGICVATLALGGCTSTRQPHEAETTPFAPYGLPPPAARPPAGPVRAGGCRPTEDNIEGPYYRPGAPLRSALADERTPGTRIVVTGRVLGADCSTPISGALLDVWQADKDGHYDNDGHAPLDPRTYALRGKLAADDRGAYELRSIVPGRYLNGPQYRPAHIHVKVSAPGYRPLTTQLYFEGDPYNRVDPFLKPELVMRLQGGPASREAAFDFVLQPA